MSNDRKSLGRVELQSRLVRVEPVPSGPQTFDFTRLRLDLAPLRTVPRVVALTHMILPLRECDTEFEVVIANPDNKKAIDELEFVTGKTVRTHAAVPADLKTHIRGAYDALERGDSVYQPNAPPAAPVEAAHQAPLPAVSPARQMLHAPEDLPEPKPAKRASLPPPARRQSRPPARRVSASAMRAAKVPREEAEVQTTAAKPSMPTVDLRSKPPPVRRRSSAATPAQRRPIRRTDDD